MLGIYDCSPLDWGGYPDQVNTVLGSLITSWAGGRLDPFTQVPSWHGGMDLVPKAPFRKPLYAVVRGKIIQAWDTGGGGWWSRLEASNSPDVFGYGHADGYVVPSLNGRVVEAGTIIGYLGTSGRSTGYHLHFSHKANARANWGDPYPALLRTQRANRYPSSYVHPGVDPVNPPVIPAIPTNPTWKELLDMGVIASVNKGPQFILEPGAKVHVVATDGERDFRIMTLTNPRHPLGGDWAEFESSNPNHAGAVKFYNDHIKPKLDAQDFTIFA